MTDFTNNISLYLAIVPDQKGRIAFKIAKENGLTGSTLFLGRGSRPGGILQLLGLANSKREIVLMAGNRSEGDQAMVAIAQKMRFEKAGQGIILAFDLDSIIGCSSVHEDKERMEPTMKKYKAIYTIVDKGKAEDVLEAAGKGGANGGTVINARGSGIHEKEKIFQIAIEPEKELVLIICKEELVKPITESIRKELLIDEPGKGIIFVQDVRDAIGLYEGK
ncbi:MAG: P-II family nitrogen regulator [Candidatus Izemoplasmatales bacterium]|jgi:nitrogen regulatory protein PII|nr:P-II family nitrogen regulator [Acholeplasmataceae bacterium]